MGVASMQQLALLDFARQIRHYSVPINGGGCGSAHPFTNGAETPMAKPSARSTAKPPVGRAEIWGRIHSVRRNYYISRSGLGEASRCDDEAVIELATTVEAVSPEYRKHLGQPFSVSLLSARTYSDDPAEPASFFGSVTLRGSQRSALAYLPPAPFWAAPTLIRDGASLICVGFEPMARGFASVTSIFLGDDEHHMELAGIGALLVTMPHPEA